ncbi:long-chain-fatty-acid--CoA ligase [Flagellimonas pelagia]|uniref:Long-chain fatty acid--CoA ligase n=1 Tax=Flagellimonas pelagia TaxID=2306998 RepID=A0A3A1NRD1_9FLAO|nr:long-chain fatty acid--CoA ligase [Allomuricauda maritima]RIV47251.1 long-chain fatty acid--CoA ligase [Allomuricauda maritima]TXK00953.1 long-chain fatty acid--CoA ligase [Allomuricauda maritima]
MLNLSTFLEDSALRHGKRPAYTCHGKTYTFFSINEEANKLANALVTIGIRPGDKIAISCPNLVQFPIVYYGVLKAGGVVVPLSILLKKNEIAYQLKDSDSKVYFCFQGNEEFPMGKYGWEAFREVNDCEHFFMVMPEPQNTLPIDDIQTLSWLVHNQSPSYESIPTKAEDIAVIIYTSGTTGSPKGAELTHANLFLNALLSANSILGLHTNDVQLITLPLFHILAMTVQMNTCIFKGAHCILVPRFDPEKVLELIGEYGVSIFVGVPTMYWALLDYLRNRPEKQPGEHKLRLCISGGASLPVKVLQDFEELFNVLILEGYGMSEGSPVVTFNHRQIGRKPGSVGTPIWGVEVKVVDQEGNEVPTGEKGELWYRGHNVMKGYYGLKEETERILTNGWLHSGDIAIKDDDGFFYIVDRIKDMIIRGGKNVYPREIEETMIRHEAISQVSVVGVPCERLGQEIKAFVVLKNGKTVTGEAIIKWTKEKIAAYKYPREIEFVKTLPLNASGKILKKELRR